MDQKKLVELSDNSRYKASSYAEFTVDNMNQSDILNSRPLHLFLRERIHENEYFLYARENIELLIVRWKYGLSV